MPLKAAVDSAHLIVSNDLQVLKPIVNFGRPNYDKRDYLLVEGNGAVIAGTTGIQRQVTVGPYNDDAEVARVHFKIGAKNGGAFLPPIPTASEPVPSANLSGLLWTDPTTNTLKYCNGTSIFQVARATYLEIFTNATRPAAAGGNNGRIWYNSDTHKVQCVANGAHADLH